MKIVKELKLHSPDDEMFEEWYDESMDVFREGNWIGRPESSIELHLLSGTKPIEAQSFDRVEPLLDNLRVLGCVKDISIEQMLELNSNERYMDRVGQIDQSYAEEDNWEMSSYLKNIYEAVPEQDVSLEFFSVDADLDHLKYNMAMVEEIEEGMNKDEDFSVTGVELSAYAEGNFPGGCQNIMDNSLVFDIYFLFGGDQTLVREYNQFTDDWGDSKQYSGVPGVVKVGNQRPLAYFFDSEELSADASRVDAWLYDNLKSNIGVKSKVRKKK